MRTVKQQWDEFAREVLPEYVSAIQYQEVRRTFYAGHISMMALLEKVIKEAQDEQHGKGLVEALALELEDFDKRVKAGQA
jgi:hypothetical protein